MNCEDICKLLICVFDLVLSLCLRAWRCATSSIRRSICVRSKVCWCKFCEKWLKLE